jgi:hypothetical protein
MPSREPLQPEAFTVEIDPAPARVPFHDPVAQPIPAPRAARSARADAEFKWNPCAREQADSSDDVAAAYAPSLHALALHQQLHPTRCPFPLVEVKIHV